MKKHRLALILIIVFLLLITVHIVLEQLFQNRGTLKFGVTFSPKYASYLKLDWQAVYLAMLDDLRVKNLRIPTYWNTLESERGRYDFSSTDFMLDQASRKGARVLLVVGIRQPRWPECHIPEWAEKLSIKDRQEEALKFIQAVVERYKQSLPSHDGERKDSSVIAFQVENEPLLGSFGEGCDVPDKNFLKKEVEFVRSLSNKTIVIADSGELGFWIVPAELSDVFGTTVYRKVYDKFFGYVTYPLPPYFYKIKSSLVKNVFARSNKKTIIVEFQAEPWLANGAFISPEEQTKLFTLEDFNNYINFAGKTGFDEAYLWGVEWWYFMAQNGHPEYLQYAKTLFK